MQGASPLASPGLNGARHWLDLRWRYPAGGLPSLPPVAPAFSWIFCPHPPARARRALFPAGRGRFWFFLCKGLRPLHPRGWMGRGTGSTCVWRCLAGGLPYLPPAAPAFSLIFCPHPPDPLPSGKGEIFSLFRRGLRPRHPGIKPLAALTEPAEQQVPSG